MTPSRSTTLQGTQVRLPTGKQKTTKQKRRGWEVKVDEGRKNGLGSLVGAEFISIYIV